MKTLPPQSKLRKAGRGELELTESEFAWKCLVEQWQKAIDGAEPDKEEGAATPLMPPLVAFDAFITHGGQFTMVSR